MTLLGTACRTLVVAGAAAAALASGSSNRQQPPPAAPQANSGAPPFQPMAPSRAIGLWRSSFGAVKIERDPGAATGVNGVWVYERQGQEVVGYFSGPLNGNVLQFQWHEPAQPADLVGGGYLVFDPAGHTFSGRWWTAGGDRAGDWQGWRPEAEGDQGEAEGEAAPPSDGPAEQAPPETI